jgi:hypothetical protein
MSISRKQSAVLMECFSIACILTATVLIGLYYTKLPESIPSHFKFTGKPNGFRGKESIWALPVFGAVQYLMLSSIALMIGVLKRPDELTTEVFILVKVMLRQLKLLLSLVFLYLVVRTLLISFGKAGDLGIAFAPVFVILIAFVVVGNVVRIIRKQRTPQSE